jgi:hypothetical protein
MALPRVKLSMVVHVGAMHIKDTRLDSYEGRHLSVSVHPDAWMGIARISGDAAFIIQHKPSAASSPVLEFLDIHTLLDDEKYADLKNNLIQQAIDKNYIEKSLVYGYTIFDDEMERELTFNETSLEACLIELDIDPENYNPEDHDPIKEQVIYTGTSCFCSMQKITQDRCQDHVDLAIAEVIKNTHQELSGIWWQDRLDESAYSAPRGALFVDRPFLEFNPISVNMLKHYDFDTDPDEDSTVNSDDQGLDYMQPMSI